MSKSFPHKDRIRRLETRNGRVSKNHRFLKFSYWFPVSFVARLLRINTLPLAPSQKTDVC